jgi:hypothetical protein
MHKKRVLNCSYRKVFKFFYHFKNFVLFIIPRERAQKIQSVKKIWKIKI